MSFSEALCEGRRLVVSLLPMTVVAFPCWQGDDMGGFKKPVAEPGLNRKILTLLSEPLKLPRNR